MSGPWGGQAERQLKTGCSHSGFAVERPRAPIPDFGRFVGRLTAVPRNLPFGGGGGWADGPVNHLVEMPGQRLLPLTANWNFRPNLGTCLARVLVAKQSFAQIDRTK